MDRPRSLSLPRQSRLLSRSRSEGGHWSPSFAVAEATSLYAAVGATPCMCRSDSEKENRLRCFEVPGVARNSSNVPANAVIVDLLDKRINYSW
jgi:hypothetical protein